MQLPANKIAEIIKASCFDMADASLIDTLLTDSRDLLFPSTTLFFALRTTGNDGHNFINDLYQKGVRRFVVDRKLDADTIVPESALMLVDDVLTALQSLATYVRSQFDIPVIAITGSRGKTIVKEQLALMLENKGYNVVRSPRSYNSQIGVPLSIWELNGDTQIAVFEAGISQPHEMARLQGMLNPTIGVFTALTAEHSEGFADIYQKAAEKAKLFADCNEIFISKSQDYQLVENAIRGVSKVCEFVEVDGGNMSLAKAVADLFQQNTLCEVEQKHIPERVSSRMLVTETLKNCLIVYDGFTFDARSLTDAINFASRHVTPGRTLTLAVPKLPISQRLSQVLKAKGVKRIITLEEPCSINADDVVCEFRDCHDQSKQNLTISDFSNEVILIKGQGKLVDEVKSVLEAPRHETVMEVDLGAITRNFNFFRSKVRPTTGIVAMVKAAGYGIGALELAKTLQNQGAAYLAVAVIDEGVSLRNAGITMPVMVMNPIGTNYKALFDNNIEPSVFSLRELDLLLDNAQRIGITDYPVHIKLDTGMHRLGFLSEELPQLIDRLKHQRCLKVSSVFSHLATADCLDQDEYTKAQLDAFDLMSNSIIEAMPYRIKRHVLNTAGILRYPEYQYDMVRLGIGLYGVSPIDGYQLENVARLVTTIISIKHWHEGITIGYGRKGEISRESVIATIPIGYADGLNRHLSNGAASVLVNGVMCKIVGNICMDQCMIDVTDANASIGDKVEIFGNKAQLTRLSDALGTIPYEILTSVSPRVKRIYFRD